MSDEKSLIAFFENAEKLFLDSFQADSLDQFLLRFRQMALKLSDRLSNKQMSNELMSTFHCATKNIKLLSNAFLDLSNEGKRSVDAAVERVNDVFFTSTTKQANRHDKQDSLNSQFLRRWFLEHIYHPFPSTSVKEELAELTNSKLKDLESRNELPKFGPQSAVKPISKNQCQLWFINTRRRSTWTEFYREFAFSDRSTMTNLVTILKDESDNTIGTTKALARLLTCGEDGRTREWFGASLKDRVAQCQEHWKKIMEWLEQRPNEQQSDWLSQAIDEATSEYNEVRKCKRDQRRKERESDLQKEGAVYLDDDDEIAGPLHSKKRAKKSKASDGFAKPLAGNRRTRNDSRKIARRSSAIANSTDPERTVSGSSTSTLDTSCSTLSTRIYATASSPLATYGKGQESIQLKNQNHLEGHDNGPKIFFSNSGYETIQTPASSLQFGDGELGDDDGEFELDDNEEANQGENLWH